jgi:hypothetical protein
MKCLTITTGINQYNITLITMETINLQDLITEKNAELQEFIKEQMRKARKQERYSRKLVQEYDRKYNANIH